MNDSLLGFDRLSIPDGLAIPIIQYLRDFMGRQYLRVDPTDGLYDRYGIVDEDVDDFILSVAESYGRRPPKDTSYLEKEILTIEDVAKFVMTFPQK